jgi:hypothetical protein
MQSRITYLGLSRFAGNTAGNRIVCLLHSTVGAFTLSPILYNDHAAGDSWPWMDYRRTSTGRER